MFDFNKPNIEITEISEDKKFDFQTMNRSVVGLGTGGAQIMSARKCMLGRKLCIY